MGTGANKSQTTSWYGLPSTQSSEIYIKELVAVSIDPPAKDNALLLTTDTEVSIAPKLHKNQQHTSSKHVPNGHPPSNSEKAGTTGTIPSNVDAKPATKAGNTQLLRVVPSRLVKTSITHTGPELIALVSPVTFDALFGPVQQKDDGENQICYQAHFKKLLGPVDPTSSPDSSTPAQAPGPRVLKAGISEKAKESDQIGIQEPQRSGEVYIGCSSSVIDKHVIFAALTESVEEWDTVRYVSLPLISVALNLATTPVSLLSQGPLP